MELNLVSYVSIALFVLSAAYVYRTTRSRSPRQRLPPAPPGWPVIGHLHLLTDMPHHALAELAKTMRAPLLRLRLGSVPAVVISKPDLARAALTSNDAAMASRPHLLSGQFLSFGCSDVTFAPAGPYHRMARRSCLADLREVCDDIVEEHVSGKHQRLPGDRDEDFVDVLLRVQKSPDLEVPLTDDNLKALVLDMFVAGTDTTFATLEWVMTELVRHPRILQKAQEEVRRVVGGKGRVEESDLAELHYMRAIIKETFRLHPAVPLLVPRETVAACTLGGYDIPAKTRVFINTFAMGRDPEIWEDPLEYSPERFEWALPAGVRAEDVSVEETFGLATRKKEPLFVAVSKSDVYQFNGEELNEV
ncbi:unnamed protein product [Triticum turgidum subsp. durum]|uniref:Cytochrome P450 n=1 Tax=Triticum turgidum subsp. durum TaxID=4567 RepID=A0A9R1AWV4_TRITD|nr:unnamed protein product [Triticum turgidum subsp. durum]